MKYYNVHFSSDEQLGTGKNRSTEFFLLQTTGEVVAWEPLELDLTDGEFADYLGNDLGVRLCSKRMRDVLQEHAGPQDCLQWLPVRVFKGKEQREYFILHFPRVDDVLGAKTKWHDDVIIKPVISRRKALGHSVFAHRGSEDIGLLISEVVQKRLVDAGCSGIEYSLAPAEA